MDGYVSGRGRSGRTRWRSEEGRQDGMRRVLGSSSPAVWASVPAGRTGSGTMTTTSMGYGVERNGAFDFDGLLGESDVVCGVYEK